MWEVPYYPAYYVPSKDVLAVLRPNGLTERSPSRGVAEKLDVEVAGSVANDAAWRYADPVIADGNSRTIVTRCRFDTYNEVEYFLAGGIVPFVLW